MTLTQGSTATRTSVSQHLARLRLEEWRVVYTLRHGHLRRLVDGALTGADHQVSHLPSHDVRQQGRDRSRGSRAGCGPRRRAVAPAPA